MSDLNTGRFTGKITAAMLGLSGTNVPPVIKRRKAPGVEVVVKSQKVPTLLQPAVSQIETVTTADFAALFEAQEQLPLEERTLLPAEATTQVRPKRVVYDTRLPGRSGRTSRGKRYR